MRLVMLREKREGGRETEYWKNGVYFLNLIFVH